MTSLFIFEWVSQGRSLILFPLSIRFVYRFVWVSLLLSFYILFLIYSLSHTHFELSPEAWLVFRYRYRYRYRYMFISFTYIFLAYFAFVSRFSRSLISFILLWFLFSTLSKQIVHSKIKIIIANFTCYCICRSRVVLRICRIRFVFSAAQMKLSRFSNAKANSTTATTTTKRQQREPSKRAAGREIAFESSLRARVSHRYLMASLKLSLNLSLSISFECEYRAHWFAYFENTFAAGVDWIECESKEQSKD